MAELKIPQKTLQDNFNLQDFKDDFNALNSEISRLEEITNTWETFKASGGEISGNLLAIQLATKSPSNNYRWAEETHNTGYKIISSNTNPSTGDWREEFIMAYDGFAPKNNKVLGTSENPWNDIFIKGVYKDTTGYTKLPNGLIMQWGTAEGRIGDFITVTLPIAFPNNTLICGATVSKNITAEYDNMHLQATWASCNRWGNVNIQVIFGGDSYTQDIFQADWFAIGY